MNYTIKLLSLVLLMLSITVIFMTTYFFLSLVPAFEIIFTDLNLELPFYTKLVIIFYQYGGIYILSALTISMVIIEIMYSGSYWKFIANSILLLLSLFYHAFVVIGLYSPLFEIIRKLGANN